MVVQNTESQQLRDLPDATDKTSRIGNKQNSLTGDQTGLPMTGHFSDIADGEGRMIVLPVQTVQQSAFSPEIIPLALNSASFHGEVRRNGHNGEIQSAVGLNGLPSDLFATGGEHRDIVPPVPRNPMEPIQEVTPDILGNALGYLLRRWQIPMEVAEEAVNMAGFNVLGRVGIEDLQGYLNTAALRTAQMYLRAKKNQDGVPLEDVEYRVGSWRSNPEETVIRRETLSQLEAAVNVLPERDKQIVIWHYFEGLKLSEIVDLLGGEQVCSENILKQWLHRARGKLKVLLGQTLVIPDDLPDNFEG